MEMKSRCLNKKSYYGKNQGVESSSMATYLFNKFLEDNQKNKEENLLVATAQRDSDRLKRVNAMNNSANMYESLWGK